MITIPDLKTALLDLLHEVRGADIKFIVGGGFGIYLRIEHVRHLAARTLLGEWPVPRSTNDLDLFLRPELIINSVKLKPLTAALTRLGYGPVAGAEKYQFLKTGPGGMAAGSVKIDILTGPQSRFWNTKVKTDERRARPYPSVGVHAHPVNEVPTLEDWLLTKTLTGNRSSGESWQAEVLLPHPFTFLMMKLFAFRDRLNDADKEYGRYHALDMYAILATTTAIEWDQACELRDRYKDETYVVEAGRLVAEYFSGLDRLGMIRMRESRYYRPELQIDEFVTALQEIFPRRDEISSR